jgi:hypothetical protein
LRVWGSVSVLLAGTAILSVIAPGWILQAKARGGDAEAMFELARWSENHVQGQTDASGA